jgi:hypothetical protein
LKSNSQQVIKPLRRLKPSLRNCEIRLTEVTA